MGDFKLKEAFKKASTDGINLILDETSEYRPAWIEVKNPPEGLFFIHGRASNKRQFYYTYLPTYTPEVSLFLPINYTKEELIKFYDRFSKYYKFIASKNNVKAAAFVSSALEKNEIPKESRIIDIGAAEGTVSKVFVENGFNNLTLLDISPEMIEEAKKKEELKNCNFEACDLREYSPSEKFDGAVSVFAFGCYSYFTPEEVKELTEKVRRMIKENGFFFVIGNDNKEFEGFETIESGEWTLDDEKGFTVNYFFGRKK